MVNILTVSALGLATAVVVFAVPPVGVRLAAARHRFTVATAPPRSVAIVLGAAMWDSGPSPLLARRLDLAVRLYARGTVRAVLVSGDNRAVAGHETDGMTDYLVASGVPPQRIIADPAGYRTWDTGARARDTYGVTEAVVVTQSFHLARAIVLCRAAGIDAVGVGDPSLAARPRPTLHGYAREAGASFRACRDAVRRPAPARVDPPNDALATALT